jgi:hypothetical protein
MRRTNNEAHWILGTATPSPAYGAIKLTLAEARQRFESVWDAIEDDPVKAAEMRAAAAKAIAAGQTTLLIKPACENE